MKQLFLILTAFCFSVTGFAQRAQGVFFSEFGENFILYINGQQQNQAAASNVKVENLTQEFVQIRVDFPEMAGQGFASNVGFEPGSETTYIIKKNRKGEYVARLHNIAPIGGATAAAPAPQATPQSAPAPAPAAQPAAVQVETRMPAEQTTTITTTTTTKPTGRDGVGINMQVPGGGINIQVEGMDMDMTIEETTTITTTTTTTSTPAPQAAPAPQPEPIRRPAIPGYNGRIGCDWPADDASIAQMKKSLESQSFEDSKMTVAKQATRGKCMSAAQIKNVMGVFTFEDSKLEYAKFAYDYCYDVDNYYILNDAFTFSSSVDELNEFIEGR